MSTFIVYIGMIGSLPCLDDINFKVSLVITIINFNEIKIWGPSSYVYYLPCECDYLSKF
jgi:hypothetical protein